MLLRREPPHLCAQTRGAASTSPGGGWCRQECPALCACALGEQPRRGRGSTVARPAQDIGLPSGGLGLVCRATCFHSSATTPAPEGLSQEGRLRSPGFRKERRIGATRGAPEERETRASERERSLTDPLRGVPPGLVSARPSAS